MENDTRTRTRRRTKKPRLSVFAALMIDAAIAALCLLVFSLYDFILPRDLGQNAEALPTPSAFNGQTASNPQGGDAQPSGADAQTGPRPSDPAASKTPWAAKFADKFTDGKVEKAADSYKSANINVSIDKVQKDGATYYVADIYIADLKFFRTAFAGDKFAIGNSAHTYDIAQANNAVIAINGDNCVDNEGPVVRNGVLYRSDAYKDVMVMYHDGSMETLTAAEFDIDKIKQEGAYQIWTFGPQLLQNGKPMTSFNSTVNKANPRTALGYFEPGHYCFVVVDGRQPGYSSGYTTQQLSRLFYDLGCKSAFNLDGGQSSEMAYGGRLVNQPYHDGRSIGDIVYIGEE